MALLLAEAAGLAAAVSVVAAAAASAEVNRPRLTERRRVADHHPHTERLPVAAEVSAAVSEVERLPRSTVHLLRVMGHHVVVAAAEVDIPEGEANPRRAMERPVPVAAASEEVDIPVVVECLLLTVHPPEAVDIPAVAVVDIPAVAAADTLAVVVATPAVAAVDTPAVAAVDIPAAAAAVDIPAVVADILAVAGKMRNKCKTIQQRSKDHFCHVYANHRLDCIIQYHKITVLIR